MPESSLTFGTYRSVLYTTITHNNKKKKKKKKIMMGIIIIIIIISDKSWLWMCCYINITSFTWEICGADSLWS